MGKETRRTPHWEKEILWVGQWAVFLLFWVLFVGNARWPELFAGAGAAAIAATASQIVWSEDLARLSIHLKSIVQAWRLPKYVAAGTWEIIWILARHLLTRHKAPSLMRAVQYEAASDDPTSATLRALAISYTTVAPNFVVVGIDRRRRYLLFHQLERSSVPRMTQLLGARP